MFNRRELQTAYKDLKNETIKIFLISTDERYFKFNGYKNNPLEMLKTAAERKYHFTDPEN